MLKGVKKYYTDIDILKKWITYFLEYKYIKKYKIVKVIFVYLFSKNIIYDVLHYYYII